MYTEEAAFVVVSMLLDHVYTSEKSFNGDVEMGCTLRIALAILAQSCVTRMIVLVS